MWFTVHLSVFLMKRNSLSLFLLLSGLSCLRICAIVVTSLSLVSPVFFDLNFCIRSVVVIGLRIRYRFTASFMTPSLQQSPHTDCRLDKQAKYLGTLFSDCLYFCGMARFLKFRKKYSMCYCFYYKVAAIYYEQKRDHIFHEQLWKQKLWL